MLIQRIITGTILALLIIAGIIYLPPQGFDCFSLIIVILAAWEFSGFYISEEYSKRAIFLVVLIAAAVLARTISPLPILVVGVLWWLIAPYVLWGYIVEGRNYFTKIVWQMVLGIVVFVPCWVGLVEIHGKFGKELVIYLLAIVCSTDIGAYFTGKKFGKNLLIAEISPKKTVEGLIGGLVASFLVAMATILLLKFNFFKWQNIGFEFNVLRSISFLMWSMIACLWSVIGDLFESMLKRQAGIKDSGKLLPGHGGMYDRIDSLTAAIPIFALGLWLI